MLDHEHSHPSTFSDEDDSGMTGGRSLVEVKPRRRVVRVRVEHVGVASREARSKLLSAVVTLMASFVGRKA